MATSPTHVNMIPQIQNSQTTDTRFIYLFFWGRTRTRKLQLLPQIRSNFPSDIVVYILSILDNIGQNPWILIVWRWIKDISDLIRNY